MSHFVVIVIGDNPEEQLAPYQENNMEDCPQEYLEFKEVEKQNQEKYENDSIDLVEIEGKSYYTWEREYTNHPDKDQFEVKSTPFKELYETFDDYMKKFENLKKDDLTGKYGYWHNPNSKWDWYVLGGRWTGYFKLKESATEYHVGRPGIMTSEAKPGYADAAQKKYIDLEGMRDAEAERSKELYDFVHDHIKDTPVNKSWIEIRGIHGTDEGTEIYHNQERVKVFNELKNSKSNNKIGFFDSVDDFNVTREEYIQTAVNTVMLPYAFIKEGKWYAKGDIGMFGISFDDKHGDEWASEFHKMIDSLEDDTWLWAFDCHV